MFEMSGIKGQSKLRFVNTYIWDQPWFVELNKEQRLAYFFIHTKCSDIGIYLHSAKAMENHLGYSYPIDEIVIWMNKKREMVIKIDQDTLLLQWMVREHSKRGTKIKPISNPDLGKIREAIEGNTLDSLIENGTFHVECKLFEFGISESIIENTSYSAKVKKGKEYSDYDDMITRVKSILNQREGLYKSFLSLIEGLSKPSQNVLTQTLSKGKAVNLPQNQSPSDSIYQKIASGFKFECADFLIEDEVKKELDTLRGTFEDIEELVINYKEEFEREYGRGQHWTSFIRYLSKKL